MPKYNYARSALKNLHHLYERQFCGDTDSTDTLVDLERAIGKAKLTKRQSTAVYYVYCEDLMQKDAGKLMGVRQHTVNELISTAERKINEVYAKWEKLQAKLDAEIT